MIRLYFQVLGRTTDACNRCQSGVFERRWLTNFCLQRNVIENAKILADELKKHNFRLVSGGTDTHLMLVDVRAGSTGIEAEELLEELILLLTKMPFPLILKSRW